MELEGKIALVTGSAKGIGRSIALRLAENGADVVVNYTKSEKEALEVVSGIKKMGRRSIAIKADVSEPFAVEDMFGQVKETFATLDILVNNAGTGLPALIEDITYEEWNKIININLTGVFLCCKQAIPMMKKNNYGKIVMVSSVAGLRIAYFSGLHYTAAKHAVNGFTKHLGYELAPHGINVNAICPGMVLTPLITDSVSQNFLSRVSKSIPTGRITTPEEQADAVMFLVSEKSKSVVGQTLVIDGGSSIGWQSNVKYEDLKKKAFAARTGSLSGQSKIE